MFDFVIMSATRMTIVWEWMHNSGQWLPYYPEISNFIEKHHKQWCQTANSRLSWPLVSHGLGQFAVQLKDINTTLSNYTIDFSTWSQNNIKNGKARPVRRQEYNSNSGIGAGILWQWCGDAAGDWQPYSIDVSNFLDSSYANGTNAVDLDRHPFYLPYLVCLSRMEQVRSGTRFTRSIRQQLLGQQYCQQAASTSVSFPFSFSATSCFASNQNVPKTFQFANLSSVSSNSTCTSSNALSPGTCSAFGTDLHGVNALSTASSIVSAHNNIVSASVSNCSISGVLPSIRPKQRRVRKLKRDLTPGSVSNLMTAVQSSSSSSILSAAVVAAASTVFNTFSSAVDAVANSFGSNHSPDAMSLKRKLTSNNVSSPPKQMRLQAATSPSDTQAKRLVPTYNYTSVQQHFTKTQGEKAKDVLKDYFIEVPPKANEDCIICCDALTELSGYGGHDEHKVVKLKKCSHIFHLDCICAMYESGSKDGSVQCPTCKQIYGVKRGNCPDGIMTYRLLSNNLPGFTDCHTVEIVYDIRSGKQDGITYTARGFPRYGYLPNNDKGLQVLGLLVKAWERRLTFTIGTSVTTGLSNVVVWNEIHHKTNIVNQDGHGYPDPNYLDNVLTELAAQGVVDD